MKSGELYTITDKTLFHIASIERNINTILLEEIKVKNKTKLMQEVLFNDLYALNQGLKLNLSTGDVKKVVIGKQAETREAQILFNIKQVFDFVKNNFSKTPIIFNFHLIQHVVKLLQTDIVEVWDIGKLRTYEEDIDRIYELQYLSFDEKNPINQLAEYIVWIEEDEVVHPLVKATVFMYIINKKVPFTGLNYISSLLFWRLILEKHRYGADFYIPLFKAFDVSKGNLTAILDETLKESLNLTKLLEITSEHLDQVTQEYKNKYIFSDMNAMKNTLTQLDLNERQIQLLKLLQQKVSIKRREYIKLFKVSPMTAYRDLNYLLENKLVVVNGQGKSTMYTLITQSALE